MPGGQWGKNSVQEKGKHPDLDSQDVAFLLAHRSHGVNFGLLFNPVELPLQRLWSGNKLQSH